MSVVDEVKQRIDIVEFISRYVPLKKAGRNFKGLCPFHAEKTPSFIVFPDTQTWHCFGACGEGGDIFAFLKKREGMDFSQALEFLAQQAGVTLHRDREEAAREQKERQRLLAAVAAAARYYAEQLAGPAGEAAREYLAKRGVLPEVASEFQLGYAPDSWRGLAMHLLAQGFSKEELLAAGLLVQREDGRIYDRFRNRLMFPICDAGGRVLGFGGRVLGEGEPKYLNSPQTPLFDKGRLLYGIDKAWREIARTGVAVIVEGYMDVLAAHQAGQRNVVASMGTAIGEAQLQLLSRFGRTFILALDADAAGELATSRGLDAAVKALGEQGGPTFAGGLLQFERRLDVDLRVAVLPAGFDPDDLIRQDPARWRELVEEAKPVVRYLMDKALPERAALQPKERARAAREILPVIALVPDAIERAGYIEELARRVAVAPELLQRELAGLAARSRVAAEARPQLEARAGPWLSREEYVLAFLLHYREARQLVDSALAEAGLEALAEADFADDVARSLFAALAAEENPDRLRLRAKLAPELRQELDRIERLWAEEPDLGPEEAMRAGVEAALQLRRIRLQRELGLLRVVLEDAEDVAEARRYWLAIDRCCKSLRALMLVSLARRSIGGQPQPT
jgi:DNA primase